MAQLQQVEQSPGTLLVPAGSLVEQYRACSNKLQGLADQALEYAEISVFARTFLHPIAGQLKDVRLRLDIWISDVDIENGSLSENAAFENSRLFGVITTAFQRMNSHLDAVGKELVIIKSETKLIRRIKQRDISGVKQAEARISDALLAITSVLRNLANLVTSIQMFRAIQSNQGPYSELHAQVSSIRAQPEESLAQISAEAFTGLGGDDEDQCPNCRRWFGLNHLKMHMVECLKTEIVPSPSEPAKPPSTSAEPLGTKDDASAASPPSSTAIGPPPPPPPLSSAAIDPPPPPPPYRYDLPFNRIIEPSSRSLSRTTGYPGDRSRRVSSDSIGPLTRAVHEPQNLSASFTRETTIDRLREQEPPFRTTRYSGDRSGRVSSDSTESVTQVVHDLQRPFASFTRESPPDRLPEQLHRPNVNHLESQAPAPTNPTSGATTSRLSLQSSSTEQILPIEIGLTLSSAQSHHFFPLEIDLTLSSGGSTAVSSQLNQPPEPPRRNRRRRRFIQWIRRRFL